MANIQINGQNVDVGEVDPATPLLWILREKAELTGTKFGCGIGACGACTVHVNGVAMRSCITPVGSVSAASITTIEGLAVNADLHPIQQAWIEEQVPQCGYCQSGMIMAVSALIKDKPSITDAEIDVAITNICRCGTYERVRTAIHKALSLANLDGSEV